MSLASWGTSAFKEDAIMSEKPQCFIECLIPSTVCNLKCSHCYVIQRHGNTQQVPELSYPVDRIKRALTKDRFGGGVLLQHLRCRGSACVEVHVADRQGSA